MTYLTIENLIKEGQIETLRIGINLLEGAMRHLECNNVWHREEPIWILANALSDLKYLKREMGSQ